jgi:hypothetical protein
MATWDKTAEWQSKLDPTQYHDPGEERMALSGRSMASVLPPGKGGIRGVIVKKSTMGGAPIGFNPSGVAASVNIVDPDGGSFVCDMSKITAISAAAAVEEAGVYNATSFEDLNERALHAMQLCAGQPGDPSQVKKSPVEIVTTHTEDRESPLDMPGLYVVPKAREGGGQVTNIPKPVFGKSASSTKPRVRAGTAEQHVATYTAPVVAEVKPVKAATFNKARAPSKATVIDTNKPSMFDLCAPRKDPDTEMPTTCARQAHNDEPANAPTYGVTFQIRNVPASIEAWYHRVIREGHVLVLGYITSVRGFPRTILDPTEEDIAIYIAGSDMFYVVADPNIRFEHAGEELQLFLIKGEYPIDPDDVRAGMRAQGTD